jgi:hypothetical protein
LVERNNELRRVKADSTRLAERLSQQKTQMQEKNEKALDCQRSFHDSFEKVLKKQKRSTHCENGFAS